MHTWRWYLRKSFQTMFLQRRSSKFLQRNSQQFLCRTQWISCSHMDRGRWGGADMICLINTGGTCVHIQRNFRSRRTIRTCETEQSRGSAGSELRLGNKTHSQIRIISSPQREREFSTICPGRSATTRTGRHVDLSLLEQVKLINLDLYSLTALNTFGFVFYFHWIFRITIFASNFLLFQKLLTTFLSTLMESKVQKRNGRAQREQESECKNWAEERKRAECVLP